MLMAEILYTIPQADLKIILADLVDKSTITEILDRIEAYKYNMEYAIDLYQFTSKQLKSKEETVYEKIDNLLYQGVKVSIIIGMVTKYLNLNIPIYTGYYSTTKTFISTFRLKMGKIKLAIYNLKGDTIHINKIVIESGNFYGETGVFLRTVHRSDLITLDAVLE